MNYIKNNITNQFFGELYIIERALPNDRHGKARWLCLCSCGSETIVLGGHLHSGNTKSCGCLQKLVVTEIHTTHGHNKKNKPSRIYKSWYSMKTRCMNPNYTDYKNYGGRGITVCDRWRESFENFFEDMGERPCGKTLDRIDNDRNYEKSNCRWATPKEQANNRRGEKI